MEPYAEQRMEHVIKPKCAMERVHLVPVINMKMLVFFAMHQAEYVRTMLYAVENPKNVQPRLSRRKGLNVVRRTEYAIKPKCAMELAHFVLLMYS